MKVARPYQDRSIDQLRRALRAGKKRVVLQLPTGAGKTFIASKIIAGARAKENRVAFTVPLISLIGQTVESFSNEEIDAGVIQADHALTDPEKPVQVASVQTLVRRDRADAGLAHTKLAVVDECFSGDTEVLTSNGFVRFDETSGDELFAQYDIETSGISFAKASRRVKRKATGVVYSVRSDQGVDLIVTGGHEIIKQHSKTGVRSKVAVENFRPNSYWRLPVAGRGTGPEFPMSSWERFMIAYQADGSLHRENNDGSSTLSFSFSKQRKIDEFLRLIEETGLRWSEVSGKQKEGVVKARRRFMVYIGSAPSKQISHHFNLASLSATKAKAIIAEMVKWDGHINASGPHSLGLNTTSKDAADFYSAVCVLAGYKATVRRVTDKRSPKFNDVFRVGILTDRDYIGTQQVRIETEDYYTGDLHCVTVPKGNIVVRRNGKPVIVGNCHIASKAIDDWMGEEPDTIFIGLSATPWRYGMAEQWDHLIIGSTIRELTEQGYLSPSRFFAPQHPDLGNVKLVAGDFKLDQLAEAMQKGDLVSGIVSNWIENGERRPTLCFCVDRAHARAVHHEFMQHEVRSAYIDGNTDTIERAVILERFSRGELEVIVNIGTMTAGVDLPSVSCVVLARPTRSEMLYIQMVGRGLRLHEGKEDCLVFDHSGTALRLGLPENIHHEELRAPRLEEREKGEAVKEPKLPTECPECSYLIAVGEYDCPCCGYKGQPPVIQREVIDSDLIEVGKGKAEKPVATHEEKQFWYSELLTYSRSKGYKDGWASNKYRDKFGVWPRGLDKIPARKSADTRIVRGWIKHTQIAYAKQKEAEKKQAKAG
jgi:DNA repair protein RadD